jgi:uncharacterized lipoprotein YddW (UPF0748 family)
MKKRLIATLSLLMILAFLASVIQASALQDLSIGSMKESISISSINNSYNTLVNKVNSAVKDAETAISQLYDLDKGLIYGYISEAREELDNVHEIKNQIVSLLQVNPGSSEIASIKASFDSSKVRIEELCTLINVSLVESKVVSARSTWYRPSEKTFAEIKANVEMFRRIGINLIFVETFYHGCSAFKSDIADIPYHPDLALSYKDTENNIVYDDYLSAFVACCEENGIEVHAWVENFYVGINANTTIVKNHPDWVMYNDDGTYLQRKEGGPYIFIDPANKDVQNLLINFYNELFQKHPEVKGLNLDYIRYPVSNSSLDTGFAPAAMKEFYSLIGKEFTAEQLADQKKMRNKFLQLFNSDYLIGGKNEANENHKLWTKYRTQVITDFVYRIKTEVKEPNGIVLSTAVFASLSESLDQKKQDWQTWFKEGWIEIATPMAYYTSASTVATRVKEMIALGGNKCLYYTGIASSYSGLPAYQNKEFIEVSYKAGACGYVIFSGAQIVGRKDVQDVLFSGVNNKEAVLPHAAIDVILSASFNDILDKSDRIYIPAEKMTAEQREQLAYIFDNISKMPFSTAEEIRAIYIQILTLKATLGSFASGEARDRINEDIVYLADILEARSLMPITPPIIEDPDNGDNDDNGGNTDGEHDQETNPDNDDVNGGENGGENEGGEEPLPTPSEKIGFFARIIKMIMEFIRKLFGLA